MSKLKYTKEECSEILINLQKEIGKDNTITQKLLIERKISKTVISLWGNMTNMKKELGLPISSHSHTQRYTKEELFEIILQFVDKYKFFPNSEYWENNSNKLGLPSVKCYVRHFGSWHEVRKLYDESLDIYVKNDNGEYKVIYNNKEALINLLNEYYESYGRVPTTRQFNNLVGCNLTNYVQKYWGTYNNFIISNGYSPNTRQIYSDEYLEKCFKDFVKENNRVPTLREFKNNKGIPTSSAYIKRFGSWGKACKHYGFKPNNRRSEYILSNGERCDSSFECKASTWLLNQKILYERNIPYKNIDKNYNGSMNCDYLIEYNNVDWYVEIAGMLWSKTYIPTSDETILYYKKLKRKEEILKNNNLNYRIIYACEFRNKSIEEIFNFLK